MPYIQCTTREIIENIESRKIFLPLIQRKFVWEEEQMTKLLDSMMQGYPFGTFLFWKVKVNTINKEGLPIYDFIKDYDERDKTYNPRASVAHKNEDEYIYLVLDGQQRLTSLYISLCGSLRKKIPKKRWDNPDAFPRKELYFNLRSKKENEEDDVYYEFAFLTKNAAAQDSEKLWYRVKDIFAYTGESEINTELLIPKGWVSDKTITNNIIRLYEVLKKDSDISYFEIGEDKKLDDVLDIFVRVNSGGTVLSKTDLLFSTIAADWKEARDEIDEFLSNINTIGDHYNFDSDFIMRTCLYILDMPILMTVKSFDKKNIAAIRDHWDEIKDSIKDTVTLLDELGFSSDNIISSNAVLPIIYYRFKQGKNAFVDDSVRNDIRKYFIISQIKKVFGGHSNQTLDALRSYLKDSGRFNYAELKDIKLAYDNDLSCDIGDIEHWMSEYKKGPYTFLLLTLLYPDLKYEQLKFEQDHIHPDAGFGKNKLKKVILANGKHLTPEQIDDWRSKKDTLPNLHLLSPKENDKRQDTPLKDWLNAGKRVGFLPEEVDFDLASFEQFYEKRKALLVNLLNEKING